MSGIGGYFELESRPENNQRLKQFYLLNSCRNALLLFIKSKGYRKISIPYFTCKAIIETLVNSGIELEFYLLDEKLEIAAPPENKEAAILYTNYFGVKDEYIKRLSLGYQNLIIDNAQSFFSSPVKNIASVYSPRKFFGLPDGGLLYTEEDIDVNKYDVDVSHDRCSHLLKRVDLPSEQGLDDFRINEKKIDNLPIMRMSRLTNMLLSQIDFDNARKKRLENFEQLHQALGGRNELNLEIGSNVAPMVYPYLINGGRELKRKLIEQQVFIASYWPEVLERCHKESVEEYLVHNLVAIPVDQRYGFTHMKQILEFIKEHDVG